MYDDLKSIEEARDKIRRARAAAKQLAHLSREEVDRCVAAMGDAQASGVTTGHTVSVVGNTGEKGVRVEAPDAGRRLVTERDVGRFAATDQILSDNSGFIITPAAKDRAKALGIWRADS